MSSSSRRWASDSRTISSGTSWPASTYSCARRPTGEPLSISARRSSPVETCGTPRTRARRPLCVPLPDPGRPSTATRTGRFATMSPPRTGRPLDSITPVITQASGPRTVLQRGPDGAKNRCRESGPGAAHVGYVAFVTHAVVAYLSHRTDLRAPERGHQEPRENHDATGDDEQPAVAVVDAEPAVHPRRPRVGNDDDSERHGQSAQQRHERATGTRAHCRQDQHGAEADLNHGEQRCGVKAPDLPMRRAQRVSVDTGLREGHDSEHHGGDPDDQGDKLRETPVARRRRFDCRVDAIRIIPCCVIIACCVRRSSSPHRGLLSSRFIATSQRPLAVPDGRVTRTVFNPRSMGNPSTRVIGNTSIESNNGGWAWVRSTERWTRQKVA